MNISEFQEQATQTDRASRAAWIGLGKHMLGLNEKLGMINRCLKKKVREKLSYADSTFREELEIEIGDALWYLAAVCTHLNLNLETIAMRTIESNKIRYGSPIQPQRHLFGRNLDHGFPEGERIPVVFTAEFRAEDGPNNTSWLPIVRVEVNGVPFGDPIDDNRRTADGYRYHDVLHMSFAAHLGWSPVLRKLLQVKRKADKVADKVDDGARARDTEEALSTLIHQEARRNSFWDGAKYIDTAFLRRLQAMVAGLDVQDRSDAEWQHCLLEGYVIYRRLVANKGGFVDVNLAEQKLSFRKK